MSSTQQQNPAETISEKNSQNIEITSNQENNNKSQIPATAEAEANMQSVVVPIQQSPEIKKQQQLPKKQISVALSEQEGSSSDNQDKETVDNSETKTTKSKNTDEENFDVMCCGLPMSPPSDPNVGAWERSEKMVIPLIAFFAILIIIGTIIGETADKDSDTYKVFKFIDYNDKDDQKVILSFMNVFQCWFLLSPIGYLVHKQKLPIEIARKMIHFFVNFMTFAVFSTDDDLSGDEYDVVLKRKFFLSLTWYPFASIGSTFFALMKPMRKVNPLANYAFHSLDRPGDRPNTLLWKSVNYCNTVITNGPYIVWCAQQGLNLPQIIPFFCIGLGDGLAEPVGRIWGKHKYYVKGLFTEKKYTRSYEGSFTVFLMSLIGIAICIGEFGLYQNLFLVSVIPITQTIIEATSPHTSDNGFMMIGIWLCVLFAQQVLDF